MLKSGVYTQLAPIRFGCGSVSTVGETAKSLGIRKAMIVTDAGVVNAGHDQKVMASLKEAGIAALLWDEVQPECPDSTLRAARKFALDNKVDGLIGLGGGSSMDTAKISSIMIPNDIDDILTHLNAYLFRERTYANPAIPVILIPTTFGTGAESTYCGVVSSEVEDAKIGVLCEPSYGIVDPTLALGLPKQGTAFTGMDAFSHALEALGHVNRTPHSDLLAFEAIRLMYQWLPQACEDIYDLEAREHTALACSFAAISFSEAGVHIGHCAAHLMGHDFHMAHGWACALGIPPVIELMAARFPEKVARLGRIMGLDYVEGGGNVGEAVADAARALMRRVGIPSLAAHGVSRKQAMAYAPRMYADHLSQVFDTDVTLQVCEQYIACMYDKYT